ncbi:hypothetical protein [Thiohalomonas denitrificans]|uniref:Uncharacterized protein n=1 Tax=Thiohalomonas denitrificans TaxID=415747 RepID=A0A1G5QJ12_9GAMM|nr:hypothetical protein [Thiohalomonas denitrificans]SCZ61727.1 hypothetical protein SAMN03097708_02190 [Thiohalomonas denitrificans]
MYTRHEEVPVLTTRAGKVDGADYNLVHRALSRDGPSIRLGLPGLKTLEMILQHDAWVVVDVAFNDLPVLAWTDFEAKGRSTLHEPVPCRIRLYHGHASMVLKRALQIVRNELSERYGASGAQPAVLPFKKRD